MIRTASRTLRSPTASRSSTRIRWPAAGGDRSSRASSPGDSTVIEPRPAATAARSSASLLPGPVNSTRAGVEAGTPHQPELAARRDVGAQVERRQVRDDRQRGVRLDRVGHVEPARREHGAQGCNPSRDDVEVVGVERRAA